MFIDECLRAIAALLATLIKRLFAKGTSATRSANGNMRCEKVQMFLINSPLVNSTVSYNVRTDSHAHAISYRDGELVID